MNYLKFPLVLFLNLWMLVDVGRAEIKVFGQAGVGEIKGQMLSDEVYSLYGEWRFFPGQILDPESALEELRKSPAMFAKIGDRFQVFYAGAVDDLQFGTYYFRLKGLPTNENLALLPRPPTQAHESM